MNPRTISSGNTTTTQKLGRRPTYTTSELLLLTTDFNTEPTSFGMKFHYEMDCSKSCFPELPATLSISSASTDAKIGIETHTILYLLQSLAQGFHFFLPQPLPPNKGKSAIPPPTQQSSLVCFISCRQNTTKFLYNFTHTGRGKLTLPK